MTGTTVWGEMIHVHHSFVCENISQTSKFWCKCLSFCGIGKQAAFCSPFMDLNSVPWYQILELGKHLYRACIASCCSQDCKPFHRENTESVSFLELLCLCLPVRVGTWVAFHLTVLNMVHFT